MCKSIRNEIVESANIKLLSYVNEEDANSKFVSDGFCLMIEDEDKPKISIQGKNPNMSIAVNITADDDEFYLCVGSSRLKEGDEWSGYEGYKICCIRAARHFAEHMLKEQIEAIEFYNNLAKQCAGLATIVEQTYFGVEGK